LLRRFVAVSADTMATPLEMMCFVDYHAVDDDKLWKVKIVGEYRVLK
jgi:hypothetical protein